MSTTAAATTAPENGAPNNDKDALMASLMGGPPPAAAADAAAPTTNSAEHPASEGLFDDIPVTQDPNEILPAVPDANGHAGVAVPRPPTASETPVDPSPPQPAPVAPTPTAPAPATSSLLAQSGLLGMNGQNGDADKPSVGGGSGLFDDIDEEQRRKEAEEERQRQEAERARLEKEQQERLEQERKQAEAAAAAAAEEQRMQEQMQSIHLGSPPAQAPPGPQMYGQQPQQQPPMQQQQPVYGQPGMQQQQHQQYVPQQQPPFVQEQPQAGFYRDHGIPQQIVQNVPAQQPAAATPSRNVYAQGMYAQNQQQNPVPGVVPQQQQPPFASPGQPNAVPGSPNRLYNPQQTPNTKAGMYNANPNLGATPAPRPVHAPAPVVSQYGKVTVSDPLLINSGSGMFGLGGPPFWSYQINTELKGAGGAASGGLWMVRRRFRHVVALEERLRHECPGAILPPRPDKHATRAIEEASAQQSAEFAVQRAAELEVYLNQLAQHPVCHPSHVLRLFFSLQDDMGTAWPEVSSNALTRLANVGKGAAVSLSESTSATKFPWQDTMGMDEFSEDNAELLALQSSEAVRMGAVTQAVPKMEGAVTLLREEAEQTGAVGMEISRLAKEVVDDRELGEPFEIVSNGMLRAGRRSKRLALELSAAMHTFSQQYKLCRYEKQAFSDRKMAIVRRSKERGKADQRAAQLIVQQRSMYQQPYAMSPHQPPYPGGELDRMERDAAVSDEIAVDAVKECEEIGERLKSEVNRIAWQRRTEWHASVKVVASAMKEATSERLSIWQSVHEQYMQAFPDMKEAERS